MPLTENAFFDALPTEIIIRIFTELDARSLLRCKLVCKRLRDIIGETAGLIYIIALAIAGQQDGRISSSSAVERLEMLRIHQAHWAELRWSKKSEYPMQAIHNGIWKLCGNILAHLDIDGNLNFVQIPSAYRNIPEREWTVMVSPRRIRDFGIDPGQDLLVLLRRVTGPLHRIWIQTMSTAEKHPLAIGSGVIDYCHSFRRRTSYSIEISLDYVGILFHGYNDAVEGELIIWEWKTGCKKLHLASIGLQSFCFLSERHVLLSLLTSLGADNRVELLVVDFEQEGPVRQACPDVTHGLKLPLPAFEGSVHLDFLTTKSYPPPSWAPFSDLDVPFHIAQEERLLVMSLWMRKNTLVDHLILVVPHCTLLSRIDLSGPILNSSPLAWDAWGPTGSRMMHYRPNQDSDSPACDIYGTKYLISECRSSKFIVHLFDFNQCALKSAISKGHKISEMDIFDITMGSLECDSSLCVTAPSIFQAGDIFREEVRTYLPYRWMAKEISVTSSSACGTMFSEDSIIVVYFDESTDTGGYHIFSF
ncbi:hypothetical protein BT96DRAFT_991162 [Gymnopus androsaceus JB14]|uniref:F-box domain-containing protein n=1 Tax=Gymnopus androsaceus JB14 TaxID=1447944 RepID=A0A6A4HWE6_9AGAR|nr:hypothetical protein BT96DRAFT_991162 [Gymnopus androsaceus JB14]